MYNPKELNFLILEIKFKIAIQYTSKYMIIINLLESRRLY